MVWSSPRQSLQCFDSSQYVLTTDQTDNICIAPTASGRRCSWDISPEELAEANELMFMALDNNERSRSSDILQRLILLRCCGDHHREKLESHSVCLSQLVNLYRDCIAASIWTRRRREQSVLKAAPRTSPPMYNRYGRVRQRYELRSGLTGPLVPEVQSSLFVPYARTRVDTVRAIISDGIPLSYDKRGEIYAIIWPAQPGFIKLGYTARTAEARAEELQLCHPGAQVIHRLSVPFPRRIERLIHLELEPKRRRIVICRTCTQTHYEWFEILLQDMIQVMNAWKEVIEADELYNYAGSFSYQWQRRLKLFEGEVSARSLLDMLKSDAKIIIPDSQLGIEATDVEIRLDPFLAKLGKPCEVTTGIEVEKTAGTIAVSEVEVVVDPADEPLTHTLPFDVKKEVEGENTAETCALESPEQKPCLPADRGSALERCRDWDSMLEMFSDFMNLISVVC